MEVKHHANDMTSSKDLEQQIELTRIRSTIFRLQQVRLSGVQLPTQQRAQVQNAINQNLCILSMNKPQPWRNVAIRINYLAQWLTFKPKLSWKYLSLHFLRRLRKYLIKANSLRCITQSQQSSSVETESLETAIFVITKMGADLTKNSGKLRLTIYLRKIFRSDIIWSIITNPDFCSQLPSEIYLKFVQLLVTMNFTEKKKVKHIFKILLQKLTSSLSSIDIQYLRLLNKMQQKHHCVLLSQVDKQTVIKLCVLLEKSQHWLNFDIVPVLTIMIAETPLSEYSRTLQMLEIPQVRNMIENMFECPDDIPSYQAQKIAKFIKAVQQFYPYTLFPRFLFWNFRNIDKLHSPILIHQRLESIELGLRRVTPQVLFQMMVENDLEEFQAKLHAFFIRINQGEYPQGIKQLSRTIIAKFKSKLAPVNHMVSLNFLPITNQLPDLMTEVQKNQESLINENWTFQL